MVYLELFIGFLKVGLFSFGGAYGAIPLIRDVVTGYGWLNDEMLSYMIAVSESTPGPIMINIATYVGNVRAGCAGAVIATLAVILPSFVIILLVTALMRSAMKNKYIAAVMSSVKPCVVGIVLATGIYMVLTNIAGDLPVFTVPDRRSAIITAVLVLCIAVYRTVFKKKPSPILLIAVSAVLGIVIT